LTVTGAVAGRSRWAVATWVVVDRNGGGDVVVAIGGGAGGHPTKRRGVDTDQRLCGKNLGGGGHVGSVCSVEGAGAGWRS
jgi:hypothetical protein